MVGLTYIFRGWLLRDERSEAAADMQHTQIVRLAAATCGTILHTRLIAGHT